MKKLTIVGSALQICLIAWLSTNCLAQSTPQVVNMINGTRYVGQTATVDAFSAEQPNPWGALNIALVDDGLRRIFFHYKSVLNLSPLEDTHPLANPTEFVINQRVYNGSTRGIGNLSYGGFNEFGHRVVNAKTNEGTDSFIQGITKITPYWCEVKTLANSEGTRLRKWTMRIATSTVPPEVLRSLLEGQIRDRNNPADFLSIVDFFRESQQYKMALDELSFIETRFPDLKDEIDDQQTVIRQARARQWIRQVNQRITVGQPILGGKMLRAFDRSGIAGEILAEMATIQSELEGSITKIEQAKKTVIDLIDEILTEPAVHNVEAAQIPMIEQFHAELEDELNSENVSRLDAFLVLANDNQMTQLQKLSLALSGWFLGSNNATQNFAVSQSFFSVRSLVVEYLSTADQLRRGQIMNELTKYEGGEPKYLAALIAQIKPPNSPDTTAFDNSRPLEFEFGIEGAKANAEKLAFRYQVQLPPEYNPYRKYPCVFTLPGDKNLDRQMLMWCGPFSEKLGVRVGQAMKNGYIVVAVDWKLSGQFEYGYTAREHKAVMTALKKSLSQFSIDTDRVFLAGHGFGADAAYDIGIAHPEHWAGIIGVSGKIDRYPNLYRDHKHIGLPIYSVVGERDYPTIQASQDAWNWWLPTDSRFDCTVVEYKGRSNEFFVEEIIEIFKWVDGHRRKLPDKSGFSLECKIRRPWDNYYWFFELHGVPLDKVVWPEFWGERHPRPITISAKLRSNEQNQFFVGPKNQGRGATLWLSPEFVDLNTKIEISGRGTFNDFVTPSRKVLLEDVRLRCDRQHPFWANVHCKGIRWEPNIVGE